MRSLRPLILCALATSVLSGCILLTEVDWDKIPDENAAGNAAQAGVGGSGGNAGGLSGNVGNAGSNGAALAGFGGAAGKAGAGEGGAIVAGATSIGGVGGAGKAGASGNAGLGGAGAGGAGKSGAGGSASGGSSGTNGGAGSGNGGANGGAGIGGAGAGGRDGAGGQAGVSGQAGTTGQAGASAGGNAGSGGRSGGTGGASIIVFDAGTKPPASALGGRTGIDDKCITAKDDKAIAGSTTHALISVSDADEIRDMPTLYSVPTNLPLMGPSGSKIADNWADLLDGSVGSSLVSANVVPAQELYWLTGSASDGTSDVRTCQGWTSGVHDDSNGTTLRARYGQTTTTDATWLSVDGTGASCAAPGYHVICIAYTP